MSAMAQLIYVSHMYYSSYPNNVPNMLTIIILLFMAILNITSYNCHGVFNSCMYVQTLLNSSDVLCIQEHYMCEDNVNFLHTMSPKHRCFARCASYYDENDAMVRKGGVAILWKMDLNCVVTKLDDIDNDRII